VNLERHEGHAAPRVFIPKADPMFIAVCAPHDEPGPWGEPVAFQPRTRAEVHAETIVAAARAHAETEVDAEDDDDRATLSRPDWEADTRSGLAVAALRLLGGRLRNLRFHVEVVAQAAQRRPALSAYASPNDVWLVVDDDERAVVATRSLPAVAFLTGLEIARALGPFVVVAVRADDFAAALYFDLDEDRFYVAEPGDVVVQAALEAARQAEFDVAVADKGVWVMGGLHEYFASLKSWALRPGDGLPF
jgi:hypothetical protein